MVLTFRRPRRAQIVSYERLPLSQTMENSIIIFNNDVTSSYSLMNAIHLEYIYCRANALASWLV